MNESDVRSQDAQLWKQLYRTAVLETNGELVLRRVLEARKAAGERAMQLIREAVDDEELSDLLYASRVLDELNGRYESGRHSRTKQSISESQVWTNQEQVS
jgi:hypothetical protein